MRNDPIGVNIDNDARAACHNHCGCAAPAAVNCVTPCSRSQRCHREDGAPRCGGSDQYSRTCGEGCTCPRCAENKCTRSCSDQCPRTCGEDCTCPRCTEGRQNGRDCGETCSRRGRAPAMVYAQHHDLEDLYCADKALLRGTLFGCLDKPMCSEHCTGDPCASQCQKDRFRIWELQLYLNTHPCDQQALALMRKLIAQTDTDCGCAVTTDCSRWTWCDGPWPWEYQPCCNPCCGKEA